MAKVKSLILAYCLDGQGGGKRLNWEQIEQWNPEQGVLWIHLNYTAQRSKQWLLNKSGLDKVTAKALLTEEVRPRSVVSSEGILLFLRGVNMNPGQDPEDMVSIRVWLGKNMIVTTRKRKLLSIDDICHAIDNGLGPKTPIEFMCTLNDRIIDRMSDVLEELDDQVDDLDHDVLTVESHLLRPKIAEIRRQAVLIRRYLAPQREALNRLYMDNTKLIDANVRVHLREANDRIIRYIEDLDSARERAAIAQEELSSRLSEQLNGRMYILSVVAVIFLPLSFVTGLLGINVGGIPGAESPWGFAIVCGLLTAVSVVLLAYLYRKKWISSTL